MASFSECRRCFGIFGLFSIVGPFGIWDLRGGLLPGREPESVNFKQPLIDSPPVQLTNASGSSALWSSKQSGSSSSQLKEECVHRSDYEKLQQDLLMLKDEYEKLLQEQKPVTPPPTVQPPEDKSSNLQENRAGSVKTKEQILEEREKEKERKKSERKKLREAESGSRRGEDETTSAQSDTQEMKTAFFSVLAASKHHYRASEVNLVLQAAQLKCSAVRHGSQLPFHLIYGGGLNENQLWILERLGWTIHDHSNMIGDMRAAYQPLYNLQEADRQKRIWGWEVQDRQDGYMTYFKFFAWKYTEFDRVVIGDLDNCFTANPDSAIVDLVNANPSSPFIASPEKMGRKYLGLNTHMMVMKPSEKVHLALVERAKSGEYIPYTNTEQDILEAHFPAHLFAEKPIRERIKHRHARHEFCRVPENCTEEKLLKHTYYASAKMTCDVFFDICYPDGVGIDIFQPGTPKRPKAKKPRGG